MNIHTELATVSKVVRIQSEKCYLNYIEYILSDMETVLLQKATGLPQHFGDALGVTFKLN